tara:strand:- start:989 stop:1177 length:189 start_codon:yes stop_codon:yes gene_type:complete
MGLFSFFKSKTKIEKLQIKYEALLKESFDLSKTDRKASDNKAALAEKCALEIQELKELEKNN